MYEHTYQNDDRKDRTRQPRDQLNYKFRRADQIAYHSQIIMPNKRVVKGANLYILYVEFFEIICGNYLSRVYKI